MSSRPVTGIVELMGNIKIGSTSERPNEKKEWSHEESRMLIEEYRKHQFLWDPNHIDYRKRQLCDAVIEKMAVKFSTNATDIRKKWGNLNSYYYRLLQTSRSGTPITWFAYEALQFLPKGTNVKTELSNDAPDNTEEGAGPSNSHEINVDALDAYVNEIDKFSHEEKVIILHKMINKIIDKKNA